MEEAQTEEAQTFVVPFDHDAFQRPKMNLCEALALARVEDGQHVKWVELVNAVLGKLHESFQFVTPAL